MIYFENSFTIIVANIVTRYENILGDVQPYLTPHFKKKLMPPLDIFDLGYSEFSNFDSGLNRFLFIIIQRDTETNNRKINKISTQTRA